MTTEMDVIDPEKLDTLKFLDNLKVLYDQENPNNRLTPLGLKIVQDEFDQQHATKQTNAFLAHKIFESVLQFIPITGHDQRERICVGSMAEFHINPTFSTIDDIDVMTEMNSAYAYFGDFDSEIMRKNEYSFCSKTQIFNIVPDALFPGYVKVYRQGVISLERISDTYELGAILFGGSRLLSTDYCKKLLNFDLPHISFEFKGPARKSSYYRKSRMPEQKDHLFITDDVIAVRCMSFPPDALEWITRERETWLA